MSKSFVVITMAAGKGTRMKSDLPKVLLPVCGRPMFAYVLDTARRLRPDKIVAVVGYKREMVMSAFNDTDMEWAIQEPQLGTGHAVAQAESVLNGFTGDVVILSGDAPLVKIDTISKLMALHTQSGAALTALTCVLDNPASYGRIIRDGDKITATIEAKDATPEQLAIKEINTGVYVIKSAFLFPALKRLSNNNAQGEYYLTDLMNIAAGDGHMVSGLVAEDSSEILGANTVNDLENLEKIVGTG